MSTSVGAEGIPVRSGENILIEDDPRRFAAACVRLLRDEKEQCRLGANARMFVADGYTWDHVGRLIAKLVERVCTGAN